MSTPIGDHWLTLSSTIGILWIVFSVILILLLLADLVVQHHPLFGLDATFGFSAWYGFAACVVLVLLANTLGFILKRPDTHYDD